MKIKTKLFILLFFSIALISLTPFLGSIETASGNYSLHFSFKELTQLPIIKTIRIPQSLMAFLVGASLSICGLVYQTLFHNDLASPFTLGVSSGAAFGAVLAIKLNISQIYFFPLPSLFAFIFGCLTVFILILLPSIRKRFDTFTLLLTGIALNFFFSSLILLISYLSNFSESFQIHRWLMGSIDEIGYQNILPMSIVFLVVSLIIIFYREELNIILYSDETAMTRGINIVKLKIILLISTSILIALSVALSGPIGFIGIICPHIAKIIFGYNHKISLPASALAGGCFLLICWTIARLIIFPFIVPVGVITSFIGGPFLIFLLLKSKHE